MSKQTLTLAAQSIGEPASLSTNPERTATTVAFRDRFTAEKLFFSARDIPGVGAVELAWVPNPPSGGGGGLPASPTIPSTAGLGSGPGPVAGKGDKDGDAEMGGVDGGGAVRNGQGAGKVEEAREVEYDVAEDDDGWIQ